jgi:hypothetical protein
VISDFKALGLFADLPQTPGGVCPVAGLKAVLIDALA